MMKLSFLALPMLVSLSAIAGGIVYDKGGMPRCIPGANGHDIILTWSNADKYTREVRYFNSGYMDTQYSCSNLPSTSANANENSDMNLVPADPRNADGLERATPAFRQAINQLRAGGNVFRPELDAKIFLKDHPTADFTVQVNRKLTADYGVGFASEVYAAYVLQNPANATFAAAVEKNLHAQLSAFDGYKSQLEIVYVKGLAHELSSAKKYDVLVDSLRAMGFVVKVVKTNSYDKITKNAGIVAGALDRELSSGKNVMLIGLSKGGTESLLGLSMLTAKLEGASHPAHYGRVLAYLGLSGVSAGSFLVDWASVFPQRLALKKVLEDQYTKDGKTLPSIDGTLDISTVNVSDVMAQVARNGLPRETNYFSLVGTVLGNGLAATGSDIRQIQDSVIRPSIAGAGANDGYIEYPGNAIPTKLVAKSYTLTLNGTHALVDSTFENIPVLRSPENVLNAVALAVMQTAVAH